MTDALETAQEGGNGEATPVETVSTQERGEKMIPASSVQDRVHRAYLAGGRDKEAALSAEAPVDPGTTVPVPPTSPAPTQAPAGITMDQVRDVASQLLEQRDSEYRQAVRNEQIVNTLSQPLQQAVEKYGNKFVEAANKFGLFTEKTAHLTEVLADVQADPAMINFMASNPASAYYLNRMAAENREVARYSAQQIKAQLSANQQAAPAPNAPINEAQGSKPASENANPSIKDFENHWMSK
jgi:hypothetical protein